MRDEFLNELESELAKLEYEEIDAIIKYYDEMILDEIDDGKDEKTVIESLGSPREIAKEIVLENSLRIRPSNHSHKNNIYTYSPEGICKLECDTVTSKIEIIPSDDDNVVIEVANDSRYSDINVRNNGSKITIEEDIKLKIIGKIFNVQNADLKSEIIIHLPKDACFEKIECETTSGSINAEGIELENLKLSLGTVSGSIDLDGVIVNKLEIESVSGRLKLVDSKANKIEADSVSGMVKFEGCQCPNIEVETVSGSIDVNVEGDEEEYKVEISTIKGDKEYNPGAMYRLSMESVSGRINYSFM